jgi:hypothetical protein
MGSQRGDLFDTGLPRHAQVYSQQLDGTYLLKTDRSDISADEAWRIYALLTRAEDAFRDMKSPLAERPIFHHLEHRVEGHIFVCLLAFHLLVAIEKTSLDPVACWSSMNWNISRMTFRPLSPIM